MLVVVKFETDDRDVLLTKLLQVLQPTQLEIVVVCSNYVGIVHAGELSGQPEAHDAEEMPILRRVSRYVRSQEKIAREVWRLRTRASCYLFFTGGSLMLLPAIAVRLARRELKIMATGIGYRSVLVNEQQRGTLLARVIGGLTLLLETATLAMAHRIGVESLLLIRKPPVSLFSSKVSVINLGIDTAKHFPNRPLQGRQFLAAFVGRLSYEKGADVAVRDFGLVQERSAKFLVAGDGPLLRNIVRMVDSGDLADRVRVTGWVSPSEIPRMLNDVRFLVQPSFTEGLPNVILEAMANGVIVVATAVGGVPDVLKEGLTGFVIPRPEASETAKVLERAMSDKNLEQIAESALALVRETYSLETAAYGFARFLAGAS